MKSTFNCLLICCAALFLSQCNKDEKCEYVYALPTGEGYMFDEGELLQQRTMPLSSGESATSVYLRACMIAREMLVDVAQELEDNPNVGFPQVGEGSYFSMPSRECISGLYNNGYSLLKFIDIVKVFRPELFGKTFP